MSRPTQPAGADPAWPDDAIEVGRIVDAWGLKGWVKVQPFAADPKALFSSRRWFILPSEKAAIVPSAVRARPSATARQSTTPLPSAGAAAPGRSLPSLLKITQVKDHGEVVVALAQEVPDRAAAEALRGARVFVSRRSFPTAGPDEFYWVDLIGLDVVNRDGAALGSVVGLLDTGPHSVLRVAPAATAAPPTGAAMRGARAPDAATPDLAAPSGAAPDAAAPDAERLIPFVAAYVDEVSLEARRIVVDWGLDY